MELNERNVSGVFFNEEDIKHIVESGLDWAEIAEDQIFCADHIMSDKTPIGTSIIVGVDGIKAESNSDILRIILSDGIYELNVRLAAENDDDINIRFENTIPIPGTYGKMTDGVLDILTDEEKEFKDNVDDLLTGREDEYAEKFRADNIRNIGGRGLILLEKIKAEIENDETLTANHVTPNQLVAVFIEITNNYINSCNTVETMTQKHDELYQKYQDTFDEGSKRTKKLASDIKITNKKIEEGRSTGTFCMNLIDAVINPVIDTVVAR